ncbi:MAG: SusC/RagA family TonB-linked outer membrane protein [Chitinophagaceae bacterium]|nr:MAG: SusC/RagA family TonB-linked outer membrane protein [Chitinophagaceae bacterium]
MKNEIWIWLLLLFVSVSAQAQQVINGKVSSAEDGKALAGVSLSVEGQKERTVSNADGTFKLTLAKGNTVIHVSHVGYQDKSVNLNNLSSNFLTIVLAVSTDRLKEVEIVNTGYQAIAKDRLTGSFDLVGRDKLESIVSTDIISRLADVTPGLIFNKKASNSNPISIRGQSTFSANTQPLIVLDNFPYDGDLANINPNDIESITVLKDAAAASIWGARAGNGVIIITSKKAKLNSSPVVSLNTNITVGEKDDLYYQPQISTADFIAVEQMLFAKGFYRTAELSLGKTALTPVVELLIANRDGKLSADNMNQQIENLKSIDVKRELDQYYNRKSVNQQVAFSLSGGGNRHAYHFSSSYDDNKSNLIGNDFNRLTLGLTNRLFFINNKLEVNFGFNYVQRINTQNNPGYNSLKMTANAALYPYAKLKDESGNLALVKNYQTSYLNSIRSNGLLDWSYRPLDELALADNSTTAKDYRLNAAVKYTILPSINAEVLYQFMEGQSVSNNLQGLTSYYTRDLINQYTQVNADGSLARPIPLGGIVDRSLQELNSHQLRSQLSWDKNWNNAHQLNAIAGAELRNLNSLGNSSRLYGYDQEHAASLPVDYVTLFKKYQNPGSTATILNNGQLSDKTDNYLSYYTNASYSYRLRYLVSASARLDQSNLFGVAANQKGTPLYSVGVGWQLSSEKWFTLAAIPFLKLRATYGYNGNIDKSISAYTTATYSDGATSVTRLPFASIENPPNPDLRWERVRIINYGLDFGLKSNWLSGSIEYFTKNSIDLIGTTPFAPSSGITNFRGNTANIKGKGLDVMLNMQILNNKLKWSSAVLTSYTKDRVAAFGSVGSLSTSFLNGFQNTNVGMQLYTLASYKWAGLDPQTGEPMAYLDGVITKDYTKIIANKSLDNLTIHGSSRPNWFGAFRNVISYQAITLMVNVNYRFGYYYHRPSVLYTSLLNGNGGHADYNLRWQKSGD